MIHTGSHGSLTFFYNDKIVCSSPLSKRNTLADHYEESNRLIREGLEKQISIKDQISFFKLGLQALADRKRYKITREDEKYLVMCFMILIKLRHYDFDDVCLMMNKKKPRKV
tara:strand:+ start:439 stop:774 length:336 start_codon:yes stop_codon:yes gene_type:complete